MDQESGRKCANAGGEKTKKKEEEESRLVLRISRIFPSWTGQLAFTAELPPANRAEPEFL